MNWWKRLIRSSASTSSSFILHRSSFLPVNFAEDDVNRSDDGNNISNQMAYRHFLQSL
jgi:hypothetical protein